MKSYQMFKDLSLSTKNSKFSIGSNGKRILKQKDVYIIKTWELLLIHPYDLFTNFLGQGIFYWQISLLILIFKQSISNGFYLNEKDNDIKNLSFASYSVMVFLCSIVDIISLALSFPTIINIAEANNRCIRTIEVIFYFCPLSVHKENISFAVFSFY